MIDICMVAHFNYEIVEMVIKNMNNINGEYRLLIGDNTPIHHRNVARHENLNKINPNVESIPLDVMGRVDGESHGRALDQLVRLTTTPVVGTMDSDFFWTNPNILIEVQEWFDMGYKAVGCAGAYPAWYHNIDRNNHKRMGFLAPVCWGMFLDRTIAIENTFVVSFEDLRDNPPTETGWKIREFLINNAIPRIVLPPFRYDSRNDIPNLTYFGVPPMPYGFHVSRGSNSDFSQQGISYPDIQEIIDFCLEKWK